MPLEQEEPLQGNWVFIRSFVTVFSFLYESPTPLAAAPQRTLTDREWECFQTGVLEKILESPLDRKEIKPDNPKGNQP